MFQCLVIYISLDKIYYVHARSRYILLSHDSQVLSRAWRTVQWSRVWRKTSTLVPGRWSAVTRLLLGHHRDGGITYVVDRASQVLAQGESFRFPGPNAKDDEVSITSLCSPFFAYSVLTLP
jgi:hypothetical protein